MTARGRTGTYPLTMHRNLPSLAKERNPACLHGLSSRGSASACTRAVRARAYMYAPRGGAGTALQ
jgi:hypothetical protein